MGNCVSPDRIRWIALLIALVELLAFSGFYYGFNALIPIYKLMGVFGGYHEDEGHTTQDQMFGYVLMTWVTFQMLTLPLSGIVMDRLGLRVLKVTASLLLFTGIMIFAFVNKEKSYALFICGCFVSLGGVSNLACNLQISSMFTTYRGIVISLLSGAFDSSTVMTYAMAKTSTYISIQTSFIILACCQLPVGLVVAFCFLRRYSTEMKQEVKEPAADVLEVQETQNVIDPIIKKRFRSLKACLISWPFLLISCWFMFSLLRFTFFLSQLGQQLNYLFPSNPSALEQIQITSSICLMCGIVVSPISGLVNDVARRHYRRKLDQRISTNPDSLSEDQLYYWHLRGLAPGLFISGIASAFVSILIFFPTQATVFVTIAFFVILRSLLFSSLVLFLMTAFPIKYFGTLNGLVNTIGGIFSLIQYGLLELHPTVSNGVMFAFTCISFVGPVGLFVMKR